MPWQPKPPQPWRWAPLVHQVRLDAVARLDAGQDSLWALIATYSTMYVETRLQPRRDMEAIRRMLRKRYPFELWKFRTRQVENSWYGVHLEMRFMGWTTAAGREREKQARAALKRLAALEREQEIADEAAWLADPRRVVPFWERSRG